MFAQHVAESVLAKNSNLAEVITQLLSTPNMSSQMAQSYLPPESSGWHFRAMHASPGQLEDFEMRDMARDVATKAPSLWRALGFLLTRSGTRGRAAAARQRVVNAQDLGSSGSNAGPFNAADDAEDEELWASLELGDPMGVSEDLARLLRHIGQR